MRARSPRSIPQPPGSAQRLTAGAAARLAVAGAFGAVMVTVGLLRTHDRWLYLIAGGALVLLSGYGFWWWGRR
jgi:hypothetical protein